MPKGLGDVPDLGEFIIQDVEKRQADQGNICEDFSWEETLLLSPPLAMTSDPPCHSQSHPCPFTAQERPNLISLKEPPQPKYSSESTHPGFE